MLVVAFNGRLDSINLAECEDNYMKNLDDKSELVDFNDLFKGRCFLKYKNTEMESLENKVKDLYKKINLDKKTNLICQSENEED